MAMEERRLIVDAIDKTPFEIYTNLWGYVASYMWIIPFAKKIQANYGPPFSKGTFMTDTEIVRRGLHERSFEKESLDVREMIIAAKNSGDKNDLDKIYQSFHDERIITVRGYQRAGISFFRHSCRFGTIALDGIISTIDFKRFGLNEEETKLLEDIIKIAIFIIYLLHDIGKFSHFRGDKDDPYYSYCIPREYSEGEYQTVKMHIHPESVYAAREEIFRANNFERVFDLVEFFHHLYADGTGYAFASFPEDIRPSERFLVSMAKIVDEIEAGSGIDRPFREPKSVRVVIKELRKKVREKKISGSGLDLISDLAIENSGFRDLRNITILPDLEKTMNDCFCERSINFKRVIDLLDRILTGDFVKKEAKRVIDDVF